MEENIKTKPGDGSRATSFTDVRQVRIYKTILNIHSSHTKVHTPEDTEILFVRHKQDTTVLAGSRADHRHLHGHLHGHGHAPTRACSHCAGGHCLRELPRLQEQILMGKLYCIQVMHELLHEVGGKSEST